MPTVDEAQLRYSTNISTSIPDNVEWEEISLAKEIVNIKEKLVVISGGSNPLPLEEWDDFKTRVPWKKNIDRNLLFNRTVLLRSPNAKENCVGEDCLIEREYKGHTWIELAEPVAVHFIPKKTDVIKPEKGHLTVKVIKKCQILEFKNEIFEMSDALGNNYVMHATESSTPNLDVKLPDGFQLKKVRLDKPLIIAPFGDKGDCYFNIVGDHLGQGYHQYKYANDYYPE